MDYLAHLRCSVCGDSWFQEMLDIEVSAFMSENPNPPLTVIGTTMYLDFEETLCGGCEGYSDYQTKPMNKTTLGAKPTAIIMRIWTN